MGDTVGLGLIGCGGMGAALVRSAAATGLARVAAAYDADAAKASMLAGEFGARVTASTAELVSDAEVQAVIVATPPFLHLEGMLAAADAGKHVFVEKPMALTVADCETAILAAQRAGVTLMVGQVLRFYEPFRTILRWKGEGRLGRLLHASVWRVSGDYTGSAGWRASKAMSGGYLYEISAHELDFMRCLAGTLTAVHAYIRKDMPSSHEIEDVSSVHMAFESGAVGSYVAGAGFPKSDYGLILRFDRGTLRSDSAFDPSRLVVDTPESFGLDPEEISFSPENPVQAQMQGWLTSLLTGAEVPVPGEEGKRTIALIEAAYASASSGEVVHL